MKSLNGKMKFVKGMKRKRSDDADGSPDAKRPKLVEMKKKERKEFRKKTLKNNYDLIRKTKQMWEELRRHDIDQDRRAVLCRNLTELVRGRAKEMIFAHDTCRVVQCLMQYGNEQQRTILFNELKDDIPELTKSKYAKFFIRKIMKYGTKAQKNLVFAAYHGRVRRLIRHQDAAPVLELCYNDHATAPQRQAMVEEFYGPSFALFKTDKVRTLEQIMTSEPLKRESILRNMKEALSPLIDKNILAYSLVHRIFCEFFTYATDKMKTEMIELLRDGLVPMLHTRDGARVAMHCVWAGSTKDRKCVMRSLKTHVVKLSQEEHGHLLLLALFDCVDDTKTLNKIVLDELLKSVAEVAENQHGRKVLLYLLSRRDPRHFHPDIIKILEHGDGNANSKKASDVRARELLKYASPRLFDHVTSHVTSLTASGPALLLLLDILTHGTGDCGRALRAVAQVAAGPYTAGADHVVEDAAGHMALKRLIAHDQERLDAGQKVLFATTLMEELEPGALKSWTACNRGCFTIVSLLELGHPEVTRRVTNDLATARKSLPKLGFKGAQILLEKLQAA